MNGPQSSPFSLSTFLRNHSQGRGLGIVSGEDDPVEHDSSPTLRNDLRGGGQGALALLKYHFS